METSRSHLSKKYVVTNLVVSGCILIAINLLRLLAFFNQPLLLTLHDLWLWAIVGQVTVFALCLRIFRPPLALWNMGLPLMGLCAVLLSAWLLYLGVYDSTAMWLIELFLALFLFSCWLMVTLGTVCLLWIALKPKSKRWQYFSELARVWLVAVSFLMTIEIFGYALQPQLKTSSRLQLPEVYAVDPEESLHIAAIGGSTMLGFPYQHKVSIPIVLKELIREQLPDKNIVISNLAETGINFRKAAERLSELSTQPDLLLIYSGHNEYFHDPPPARTENRFPMQVTGRVLGWSGSYRLLSQLTPQAKKPPSSFNNEYTDILHDTQFTKEYMMQRHAQFKADVSALAQHCQKHSIATLWFLPATNEGVFTPNSSECARVLSQKERDSLNQRFRLAMHGYQANDYAACLKDLNDLNEIYPAVAEIEYWIGKCHQQLGAPEAARSFFRSAQNHDGYPPYITDAYRNLIKQVTTKFDYELIDAEQVLRAISPSGLLDRHIIHDNVHPTLRSFYKLGESAALSQAIEEKLRPQSLVRENIGSYQTAMEAIEISPEDLAIAYLRTTHCLRELRRFRLHDKLREIEAQQYERLSIQLKNGDIKPGEEGTEGLADQDTAGVRLPESQTGP